MKLKWKLSIMMVSITAIMLGGVATQSFYRRLRIQAVK